MGAETTSASSVARPQPSSPNIDALPAPTSTQPIDLESLAKRYESLTAHDPVIRPAGPRLLIFVSFAMPPAALDRLIEQATATGATLYLRGLVDGSLRQTVSRVQPLLGQRRVPLEIDPRVFDRYAVDVTPSFVLVHADANAACAPGECAAAETFAKVAGDVSLGYALEFLAASSPALATIAGQFLARLKR